MARAQQKIITDEKRINELLTRSVAQILPSAESLKKELLSGKRLRVYMGIDPTADYVHLGHTTNYLLLKRFHDLGHQIVVLVGDFTAMIGDPSDKTAARVRLSREDVLQNLKSYKKQIGKILDFSDKKNPILFRFNSTWLSKLAFGDVVELASYFTVQQMIQRDVFERRLNENKPLYVHEFFYPLMQGYDSVALGTDVEIGGTDQTFNMLAGRTLVQKMQQREKFVITTTLLENPKTGEKLMSKSKGTGVGINEPAREMYAKIMRLPDDGIPQCFVDCTEIPLVQIESLKKELQKGENPKNIKMQFAKEIVRMYHGKKEAEDAEKYFTSVFSRGEASQDIPEIATEHGITLDDFLHTYRLVPSKSEARRLVLGGAIKNLETGEPITNVKLPITIPVTLKIGKKAFIRIRIKKSTRRKE